MLALFLVFLILAAQYESWGLPFSVLLGTPFAAFGAYLGLWFARQVISESYVNNVFAQIGLIMITYSRAVRVGDFVKIGDVEGTVLQLGILSTKIRTLRNEEATIPNAVVVSNTITDYSRYGDTDGVFTPTSVTIGYDTPCCSCVK